jgi:formylglycine-generating enzyme required for sulfatase activity
MIKTPLKPSKNHAPRITGLLFALLMSVIGFPVFAQTAPGTSCEKELERLMAQRDKEIASAVNPIQKRFELATQQLLRKALQTGDLEAANKLKAMIDQAGGAAGENKVNGDKNMVRVDSGTLPSGSGLAGQVVATFQIGKYEVTWGDWQKVRDWAVAKGYDLKDVGQGLSESHPVTHVNWCDVMKWCNAKSEKEGKTPVYQVSATTYKTGETVPTVSESANGYRLPSEAEWEWAARGGKKSKGYTYSGSNDLNAVGWFKDNAGKKTQEAGKKLANELGIYDMSGNVWEWCFLDLYGLRHIRGGSWNPNDVHAAVADRGYNGVYPDYQGHVIGFRLARSSGN